MTSKSTRSRLMASTIIFGAAALALASAGQAMAQATPAPSASPTVPQTPGSEPSFGPATPTAQKSDANTGATGASVSEVTVTGSRIRSPNLTSASPLTVINDQELKLEGTANVENLLNNLPQVVADQQSNVSNGSRGIATVNLRALGATRTLVLVDGRRLQPGDPIDPVADLNNIPAALVSSVDVVTGGASAVYGSDAVAGVVNFIMKKDFQGVQFDSQYGFAQHNNDKTSLRDLQGVQGVSNYPKAPGEFSNQLSWDVSAIIGANAPDGKGNVTAYATYRNLTAITQDKYDVSACSLASANVKAADSYTYDGFRCSGSSNGQYGRFKLNADSRNPGSLGSKLFHVNTDGSQTFVTSAVPAFSYGPLNYLQRPDDRYTGGYFAHYELNKHFDIYSTFMFTDDHSVAQIAPSGLFAGTGPAGTSFFKVNCNNPLLAASQATQLCGTAAGTPATVNAQIGFRFAANPRQDDLRHTSYKIDLGTRGDLGEGWTYDAYLQYGTAIYNEHYNNDASLTKIQNALLVNPDGTCQSDPGKCVPLNIFRFNALTPQQTNYVITPGFESGQTVEQIASASVTGDLGQYGIQSPFATSGLGVAFGTEYRREQLNLNVDNEFATGDLSGQGGPKLANQGSFDVYELYGEVRVPLVEGKPFIKRLSLNGGYRFSDYSKAGITNAYKGELEWQPIDDVRFRGGYNRAVRAPNVNELFTPQQVGNIGASDPCAGAKPQFTLAQCAGSFAVTAGKLGVDPTVLASQFYGNIDQCPAGQCEGQFSGNLGLKPETADTYSVGAVFTPTQSFLHGFTASVDYFNILVRNLIQAPPGQIALNECVNGITSACNLITRDPASGIVFGQTGFVNEQTINSGFIRTSGIDFAANYKLNFSDFFHLPDVGSLAFSFIGTYTDTLQTQPIIHGPKYECVGYYGPICGTPYPEWRHKLRVTYTPNLSMPINLSLDWRHIGENHLDANQTNYLLANHPSGITDTASNRIHPYDYIDLSGTWRVRDHFTVRAGVNNVFDIDPPALDSNNIPASSPPTGNANTYPGVYDTLGRTFFVGLTADF